MTDDQPLPVGATGFIFDHGNYWPARVICNDLMQTFGPIDAIVAYRKHADHEHTVRLVRYACPCTGLYWVSTDQYKDIELARLAGVECDITTRLAELEQMI